MKFSKSHEWVRLEDKLGAVGISQFAVEQLGDIVYVELPEVGKTYSRDEEFGVVESVKAVSSLYVPVSGKVVAVNTELNDHPELLNQDPYGKGWLIKLELTNPDELTALLSAQAYEAEMAVHQ